MTHALAMELAQQCVTIDLNKVIQVCGEPTPLLLKF